MASFLPMADLTRSCIQASLIGVPVDHAVKMAALASLSVLLEPADGIEYRTPYKPYSRLTPTGFPVEVAFGNPSNELRFATEVGGAAPSSMHRLALTAERFHDLGHVVDPALLAWCEGLQDGQTLKYGTWASLRVGEATHACKLYVEVPLDVHSRAIERFNPPGDLANVLTRLGARITMLGLTDDDEIEFYFGLNGMRLDKLPELYDRMGVTGGGGAVIKALEAVCGRYLNRAVNNRQNGLSFKQTHTGEWLMTVFCQADDLFASGAQTRKALLHAAPMLECDLSSYEAFSRPVRREVVENRHCMLAFTPLPNGKVDLRVGLSPTPPNEAVWDSLDSPHSTTATDHPFFWEPQSTKATPSGDILST